MEDQDRGLDVAQLERMVWRWKRITLLALAMAGVSLGLTVKGLVSPPRELRLSDGKVETIVSAAGVVNQTVDHRFSARFDGRGLNVTVNKGDEPERELTVSAVDGLRVKADGSSAGVNSTGLVAVHGDHRVFVDSMFPQFGLGTKTRLVSLSSDELAISSIGHGPAINLGFSDDAKHPIARLSLASDREKMASQLSLHAGRDHSSITLTSPADLVRNIFLMAGGGTALRLGDVQRHEAVVLHTGGMDKIDEPQIRVERGEVARTITAR